MRRVFGRCLTFLRADFREEITYPWVLANEVVSILMVLTILYFVSQLVSGSPSAVTIGTSQGYFPFAVLGVVAMDFLYATLTGFNQRLRQYQLTGMLEACLVTRTPLWQVVLLSPSYSVLKAAIRAVFHISAAMILFGVSFDLTGVPLAVLTMSLGVVVFMALGVISAAITLVMKRGDPLAYLINGASVLLGGVFYPIEVLPRWLRGTSELVPVTAVLRGVRAALAGGTDWGEAVSNLLVLLTYLAVVVPLAWWTFRWASRRVLQEGSISHY